MWGAIHPDVRETSPDANFSLPGVDARIAISRIALPYITQKGRETFRTFAPVGEKAVEP